MGHEDERCAVVEQIGERRQGFADAAVVRDVSIGLVLGNIEIDADEHAFVLDINVSNGLFLHGKTMSAVTTDAINIHCHSTGRELEPFVNHVASEVGDATRIAPFVVIPRNHFEEVASDDHGQFGVDDG